MLHTAKSNVAVSPKMAQDKGLCLPCASRQAHGKAKFVVCPPSGTQQTSNGVRQPPACARPVVGLYRVSSFRRVPHPLFTEYHEFAMCRPTVEALSACALYLPIVSAARHGKQAVCRFPDELQTTNVWAHHKLLLSGSGQGCRRGFEWHLHCLYVLITT